MKLTVGRMAHVKVEKGCVEALLLDKGRIDESDIWIATAVRENKVERAHASAIEIHAGSALVHEPYGCMREIVMLPPREYPSFGPVPGSPDDQASHDSIQFFTQEAVPGAQPDPFSGARLDARVAIRSRISEVAIHGPVCGCHPVELFCCPRADAGTALTRQSIDAMDSRMFAWHLDHRCKVVPAADVNDLMKYPDEHPVFWIGGPDWEFQARI